VCTLDQLSLTPEYCSATSAGIGICRYALDGGGLGGARLGVLRLFADDADADVGALFEAALRDLTAAGTDTL